MTGQLKNIITSADADLRNTSLDAVCRDLSLEELLAQCEQLDTFRRSSDNLYERVRALFFLYAIHRFHLPMRLGPSRLGRVSFEGYTHLLSRRFEEAIEVFLSAQKQHGPSDESGDTILNSARTARPRFGLVAETARYRT